MTIVSLCLSPGLQRSVTVDTLALGEVNRLRSIAVDVAGKGINVCRVLQRLHIDACCLSQGGSNGDQLARLAADEELDLRLIPSTGQLRTCTSIIETTPIEGCRVTELIEPSPDVTATCMDALRWQIAELLPRTSALVIAGSMAPGFPVDYQAQMARLAQQAGVPVFLDLQGAPLRSAMEASPALVKINLSEFVATFLADHYHGGEHSGLLAQPVLAPELIDAVADVSRRYAASFVLTRGARSILLASGGAVHIVPVTPLAPQAVRNPIGSGDAFLAGLVARLVAAPLATGQTGPALPFTLPDLAHACAFATACAQSNARTDRPGFLEAAFALDYRA